MTGRDVVPFPLGPEVGEHVGVEPPHPVVRVGSPQPVRHVLVRLLGRARGVQGGPRPPRRAAALLAAIGLAAVSLTSVGTPATASGADDKVTFTVGITNEVDSFNPFLGIEAESYE